MSKARRMIEAVLSSELDKDVTIASKNGRVKVHIVVDGHTLVVSLSTNISSNILVDGGSMDLANFHSLDLKSYLQERNFDVEFRQYTDDLDASLKVINDKIRKSLQRYLTQSQEAINIGDSNVD